METIHFRRALTVLIILALVVLSFLVIQPILMSIIFGLILAFVLSPIYNFFFKLTKSPNFSTTIVIALLIVIVILPLWFLTPIVVNQAFKLYMSAQSMDYTSVLQNILPTIFGSPEVASDFGGIIQSFVIKGGNTVLDSLSQLVLDFPILLLHLAVVLFALYFALRDKKQLIDYVKSLSPFAKEVENKLFKSSKDITASVLYGQVIIGILQGIIIGIAFFLFGVPNALLLTMLAVVLGVLPIVGPMFVWVPVCIYLLLTGDLVSAIGIFIFGVIASNIDNILRPLFVSRLTKLHSAVVLIGMIGGLFVFGVLGLILGPLILAYLIIILEVYRSKGKENTKTPFLMKAD